MAGRRYGRLLGFLLTCDVVMRGQPRFEDGWLRLALVRGRKAIIVLLVSIIASLVAVRRSGMQSTTKMARESSSSASARRRHDALI